MLNKLCFLICTEAGFLEAESILLCKSIRKYGGRFADAPIYSFAPRKGRYPNKKTIKTLEDMSVNVICKPLNSKFFDYPYANKPIIANYSQKNLNFQNFVFLDSDIINFKEPKLLKLSTKFDAAVAPVHITNTASTGRKSKNEIFWKKMYKEFDISEENYVKSIIEKKKIRSYWNAGVVCVKKETEVFGIWLEVMEKMFQLKAWPSTGKHFSDEISLTLTLLKNIPYSRILQLPIEYNFPMYAHKYLNKNKRWCSFEKTVFYHYMNTFESFPERPLSFFKNKKTERTLWLRENLSLFELK